MNVEQARIAEEAGAVAVMALERIPADIRVDGGVARMSDPKMIREIKAAVSIPVMAKVRERGGADKRCGGSVQPSNMMDVLLLSSFEVPCYHDEHLCRTRVRFL